MNSDGIDILKLYVECDAAKWNAFLSHARAVGDVRRLADVLRRLQIGMKNLADQKLNTEKVNVLFIRLQRSIENTLKQIHRDKNPNPLFASSDKALHAQHLADKKRKNHELELFLKKVRY